LPGRIIGAPSILMNPAAGLALQPVQIRTGGALWSKYPIGKCGHLAFWRTRRA